MVRYFTVINERNRNTMYHTAICNIEKYIASTYADAMYLVINDYESRIYSSYIIYNIPHREYYLIYYVFKNILTIYFDAMCFSMMCCSVDYPIVTSDIIKLWYYTTCIEIGNMINMYNDIMYPIMCNFIAVIYKLLFCPICTYSLFI